MGNVKICCDGPNHPENGVYQPFSFIIGLDFEDSLIAFLLRLEFTLIPFPTKLGRLRLRLGLKARSLPMAAHILYALNHFVKAVFRTWL